jgi:hypothetical protein
VVGVVLLLRMAQPTVCDSRPRLGLQAHLWKRRQTGRGGPGRRFPSSERGVIDRVGMETCDGPGLFATSTLEWSATFEPSAQPLDGEGVTNHADSTSTFGGHLELAQVSVVRPVLGRGMRPAHRPALALGALHLRAHAHGHQHHAGGRGLLPIHSDRRGGEGLRGLVPTTGK